MARLSYYNATSSPPSADASRTSSAENNNSDSAKVFVAELTLELFVKHTESSFMLRMIQRMSMMRKSGWTSPRRDGTVE